MNISIINIEFVSPNHLTLVQQVPDEAYDPINAKFFVNNYKYFNQLLPIITDETLTVIEGDEQVIAARKLNIKEIPVIRLPAGYKRKTLSDVLRQHRDVTIPYLIFCDGVSKVFYECFSRYNYDYDFYNEALAQFCQEAYQDLGLSKKKIEEMINISTSICDPMKEALKKFQLDSNPNFLEEVAILSTELQIHLVEISEDGEVLLNNMAALSENFGRATD